jgi:hypothetical protein
MTHRSTLSFILLIGYILMLLPRPMLAENARSNRDVPGETLFRLDLLSPISTATNQKGDKFDCRVLEPREFAGSIVSGEITKLKHSGKVDGKSEMVLAFGKITLTDGSEQRFGAQVVEVYDLVDAADRGRADEEGSVRGRSTHKRDALKIGVGAAIGAIIGGILGGAKGAAIGGAIGAAFGATTVLATKGPDLEFKQGTQFTVRTDKRHRDNTRGGA